MTQADEAEDRILKLASFKEPNGWAKTAQEFAGDPSLRFLKDSRTISIQLFGGKRSRYLTAKDFLASPEARDFGNPDKPAVTAGMLMVGEIPTPSYKCSSVRLIGDPHIRFPPPARIPVEEIFVVVPAGERFFVLKLAIEGLPPVTEEEREQRKADWLAFLKSFQSPKRSGVK